MGVVRTVAVYVSGLPTIKAEVVAVSMIAFCKGDMAIRRESCRGIVRGGCRVGPPIIVIVVVGVFSQVAAPTVPGLGVAFHRSCVACL